jgi:hypothetical protein
VIAKPGKKETKVYFIFKENGDLFEDRAYKNYGNVIARVAYLKSWTDDKDVEIRTFTITQKKGKLEDVG